MNKIWNAKTKGFLMMALAVVVGIIVYNLAMDAKEKHAAKKLRAKEANGAEVELPIEE